MSKEELLAKQYAQGEQEVIYDYSQEIVRLENGDLQSLIDFEDD